MPYWHAPFRGVKVTQCLLQTTTCSATEMCKQYKRHHILGEGETTFNAQLTAEIKQINIQLYPPLCLSAKTVNSIHMSRWDMRAYICIMSTFLQDQLHQDKSFWLVWTQQHVAIKYWVNIFIISGFDTHDRSIDCILCVIFQTVKFLCWVNIIKCVPRIIVNNILFKHWGVTWAMYDN